MKRTIIPILSLILASSAALADDAATVKARTQSLVNADQKGWQVELRAGYNLGGTSPLPIPAEIRSIDSYNPTLGFSIEASVTKWLDDRWGVSSGVKFENKNMETDATVKNYGMEIHEDDGGRAAGRWTGGVHTNVRNSLLTVPILGVYKVHPRTNLKLGVYLSYLMEGKFDGYVYEGYLRNGDPTGEKAEFYDGNTATYDFSDDLRNFQWGLQLGVDWVAFKHLKVYGDLSWGLNDIFPSDFNTITFAMYPIYLNVGVGYVF